MYPSRPHFLVRLLAVFAACVFACAALPAFAKVKPADVATPHGGSAAEATHVSGENTGAEHAEHAEHGLPPDAPLIAQFGWFKVNNSMVITWVVALLLIFFARVATAKIREVPEGAQNFWEWLVENLFNFLEELLGYKLTKKSFWFFATIFIFILSVNWFGLIPGVGSVGWGTPDAAGRLTHISTPLLRGANADFNMTFAMSCLFFLMWTIWAIQANGPGGFIMHLFGPKGDATGFLKVILIAVFIFSGVLEVVSILFRPVSLSFRLYGNIFAGENMLETMATLIPALGWLLAIPFYFLELIVGVVQALVFMLLTAVFTLLICEHDDSHGEHSHQH